MKTVELSDGSDEKGMEEWEKVEWEEAGSSSDGDELFPGGGAVDAAEGSDAVTRRGGGNVEGCGDDVTRRDGLKVEEHGRVVLMGRTDGGEEPVVGVVFPGGGGFGGETGSGHRSVWFGFGGGRGGEDEDWDSSSTGSFHSSVSLLDLDLDLDWDEDRDDATKEWEMVEATGAGKTARDETPGMDVGRDEGTRGGAGEVADHGGGGWTNFAKHTFIAGGARLLFYPTVLRNLAMERLNPNFHWFDAIDENIVLGAVPFRSHVPHLMELGVRAVVTLTEPFETLVQKSDYQAHGVENLTIPTPDYSASPTIDAICRALSFMRRHALRGHSIYVHCKAGRGRSTTVVLCYLIRYKNMTAEEAWRHTHSIRPRISLTRAQNDTVTQFGNLNRTGLLPLENDDAEKFQGAQGITGDRE